MLGRSRVSYAGSRKVVEIFFAFFLISILTSLTLRVSMLLWFAIGRFSNTRRM